ncbi:MAG: PHP domain-containing protein, partial [Lachnospiraceae bacterium]|nr:PHP domain-containing protein [Lachnospiraceae bacterium]
MKIVDLHNHSTASDGSKRPSELVDIAIEKGLSAFALTDHDTT